MSKYRYIRSDGPSEEDLLECEKLFAAEIKANQYNEDRILESVDTLGQRDMSELQEGLLDFDRTEGGYKRKEVVPPKNKQESKNIEDDSDDPYIKIKIRLCDLNLSEKIGNALTKAGISNVLELMVKDREELLATKLLETKDVDAIISALLSHNLHLFGDTIYICDKCGKEHVSQTNENLKHYCAVCSAKQDRISEISDFQVTLSGPEYSDYTISGNGFALYGNITNNTDDLKTVKVIEFYVVTGDRQRVPDSYLSGYHFNDEIILPHTSKCCAKVWSLSKMDGKKLKNSDYSIITIEANNTKHIFKFIFNGTVWSIDDYYKV